MEPTDDQPDPQVAEVETEQTDDSAIVIDSSDSQKHYQAATFGIALLDAKAAQEVSFEDIGQAIGHSTESIVAIFNGQALASPEDIFKLSSFLHIDQETLERLHSENPHAQSPGASAPPEFSVRMYRPSDAEGLQYAANNQNVQANLTGSMPFPYTIDDARWWIDHCHNRENWQHSTTLGAPAPLNYAITIVPPGRTDEVFVGSIGLEFRTDVYSRNADLGYWLSEEMWGRGIMTRAVKEFVTYVWRTFPDLTRLSALVYSWNPASAKVLQKAGFKHEGRQKMAVFKNGRLGDVDLFGLVRPGLS